MNFTRRLSRKLPALFFLSVLFFTTGALAASSYKPSGTHILEDVFIIGPHPCSNPLDVIADHEPIMRYLESKLPQTRFQVEASKNYADYENKLAAQHFQFSLPNNIGHVMGIKTIAEFVENQANMEKLRSIGVDFAQGYNIAQPSPLIKPEPLELNA